MGFPASRFRTARAGLDRGRGLFHATWYFVTPDRSMLPYAQIRKDFKTDKEWKTKHAELKKRGWLLFQSGKEAKRWIALSFQQDVGMVRNLERQRTFDLLVARPDGLKERIGGYKADFVYELRVPAENMATVEWEFKVEDVKGGPREDLYKWKRKHFEAQFGCTITES